MVNVGKYTIHDPYMDPMGMGNVTYPTYPRYPTVG